MTHETPLPRERERGGGVEGREEERLILLEAVQKYRSFLSRRTPGKDAYKYRQYR